MRLSIFRPIIFGLLFWAALFFAPFFILKVILFFFIIGGLIRLFFWGRHRRWGGGSYYVAYADKMRSMSEEEYKTYKEKMGNCDNHYCCYPEHGRRGEEDKKDTNSKTI